MGGGEGEGGGGGVDGGGDADFGLADDDTCLRCFLCFRSFFLCGGTGNGVDWGFKIEFTIETGTTLLVVFGVITVPFHCGKLGGRDSIVCPFTVIGKYGSWLFVVLLFWFGGAVIFVPFLKIIFNEQLDNNFIWPNLPNIFDGEPFLKKVCWKNTLVGSALYVSKYSVVLFDGIDWFPFNVPLLLRAILE